VKQTQSEIAVESLLYINVVQKDWQHSRW